MTRCTEPERWTSAPGADAPEEVVESYLAHLSVCPFHAAIEQREDERVRGLAAHARLDLDAPFAEAQASATDGLDAQGESRHGTSGRTLSVRVDGVERARLALAAQRPLTLEVEAGALVALWQPGRDGGRAEVYLTSYVIPVGGGTAGAKQVSEIDLASGERIVFTTEARADGRRQLTVSCAASGWARARHLSAAQRVSRPSDEPVRPLRRLPVWRLTGALCALVAVGLLALVIFQPEQPVPVAQQEQPTRASAPDVSPTPGATPSSTDDTQNRQEVAPAAPAHGHAPTPRASQRGVRVLPPPRTREHLTVADVRHIYVSPGEGDYDRQLREALIEQLRDSDRFTVVTVEQQADALLLREQPRSAGVSVQLLTRGGKTLWFTTQPATASGGEGIDDLAARIVAALTAAADQHRTPVRTPRR